MRVSQVTNSKTKSGGKAFRALHEREKQFIIPNPWTAGTARILADLGFGALASSSAALAGIVTLIKNRPN